MGSGLSLSQRVMGSGLSLSYIDSAIKLWQGLFDSNSHARSTTSPIAVTGAKMFITTMLFVRMEDTIIKDLTPASCVTPASCDPSFLAKAGISIDAVLQREADEAGGEGATQTDLIILTHDCVEAKMNEALGQMQALMTVLAPIVRIRKEELA